MLPLLLILQNPLKLFQDNFAKALSLIYDKYTVDEWMEQHIDPLMNMLTSLMQRAQTLTNADIWPRRPLNFKKLSKSSKIDPTDNPLEEVNDPKLRHNKAHSSKKDELLNNNEELRQEDVNRNPNGHITQGNEIIDKQENLLVHTDDANNERTEKDLSLTQSNS